jgi:4-diphosphocytidyl-2-C-methyl-D-erythritol kinase
MVASLEGERLCKRVAAPAKVNLSLRVIGRLPDGYHLLDSLFVPIDLCDELTIELMRPSAESAPRQAQIAMTADGIEVPLGPANLVYRAAAVLLGAASRSLGLTIHLRKRIPVGSGLGGGSSDAAATLLAVNRLLGAPYGPLELAALGAQLGADVPFFVHGRPARVGGAGERVVCVGEGICLPLVVCWDGCGLSTEAVYSQFDLSLTRGQEPSNIATFVSGSSATSEWLVNDLEAAAAQIHPNVVSLKARMMEQGARAALMTGSGSAVFGVWRDTTSAREAARRLREQGMWAEAVHTLDRSPALDD